MRTLKKKFLINKIKKKIIKKLTENIDENMRYII